MAKRKASHEAKERVDDMAEFAKLKGWVKESMEQHGDWYKEAEECFAFVSGRGVGGAKGQWPDDSWDEMIGSGRQPIEFNRVGPIVDAVCGLEVNNRQEVKFLPRTQGDVAANERLSSLGEWARDESHADEEESEMFRNAVICGRGATETRIDFDEEPTGKICVDNLDTIECGVDPSARKASLADRRYSWRVRDMSLDDAKAMFPGMESATLHASWATGMRGVDGGQGNKTDYPEETRAGMADQVRSKLVRIVQIEWWERETRRMVAMEGAEDPQEMSEDAFNALGKDAESMKSQKVNVRTYHKAFLGMNAVLDKVDIEAFQINWVTGRYDRNKGWHYGVVRPMRDPQMLSNKTLSQVLHILNTNAKGGLIIEAGAFRNVRDAEKDWSDPSKTIVVNEGGIGKIKDRTAPAMPQALVQLQEFSLSSIRDVTGVSVEMLGLADRDQPASLEYQRRQSAMTILAGLFSSLRLYRKMQGKTLLTCLKLLPPGVLVRVLIDPEVAQAEYQQAMMQWQQSPEVQQYMQAVGQAQQQGQQPPPPDSLPPQPEQPGQEFLMKTKRGEKFDANKFGLGEDARFDVIVDEAPISPNQKEATWAALQPFMATLPPNAVKIALKYSPLPETAAEEMGNAIEQASQPQADPQAQKAMQEGQKQLQALSDENAQLKDALKQAQDQTHVDEVKVNVAAHDSETRRMKAEAEIAQPTEIDELRQHLGVLAQGMQAMMQHLQGGNSYGG